MEYLYAALLLHKSNKEINEKSVSEVLTAAGAEVDENRLKPLILALEDVNIEDALANTAMTQVSPVAGEASGEDKAQGKKEEEPEEEEADEADMGLGSLFG